MCVCVCVCVCVCARTCARACVCACARVCVKETQEMKVSLLCEMKSGAKVGEIVFRSINGAGQAAATHRPFRTVRNEVRPPQTSGFMKSSTVYMG